MRALQATCIAQLEDEVKRQSSQLRHQAAVTCVLHAQVVSNKQEIQWLRDRVRQLQYVRHSIAAKAATCQPLPAHGSNLFLQKYDS